MQIFKPVTLESYPEISEYLSKNTYGICDYSFSNIFCWQQVFDTHYAVIEGYLILRSLSHHKKPRYLMPIGGETKNLKSVMEILIEESKKADAPFEMVAASEEFSNKVSEIMPDTFQIEDNRDYCDYVYLSSDLITLKGKKLHSKRNHINKFRELYPDHEYVEITPEIVPECVAMHKKWCKMNGCTEAESLNREKCAVERALKYFESLPLKGGALRVNSEMVAFTLGQKITNDTFDVMIEKAFSDVQGAYTMINQMFAEHECENFVYINREEDLGVEGLRKAKLSYNPVKLMQKFVITLK